jgi:hypothetical protein
VLRPTYSIKPDAANRYANNDFKYFIAPGFGSTGAYSEHMLGAVETLLEEGKDGKPKMMTIGE